MTKSEETFAAMLKFVVLLGCDPDATSMIVLGSYGSITLNQFVATPTVRASLVEILGNPKRGGYQNADAAWDRTEERPFIVAVYSWPWTTCGECGAEKGAPVLS